MCLYIPNSKIHYFVRYREFYVAKKTFVLWEDKLRGTVFTSYIYNLEPSVKGRFEVLPDPTNQLIESAARVKFPVDKDTIGHDHVIVAKSVGDMGYHVSLYMDLDYPEYPIMQSYSVEGYYHITLPVLILKQNIQVITYEQATVSMFYLPSVDEFGDLYHHIHKVILRRNYKNNVKQLDAHVENLTQFLKEIYGGIA